MAAVQYGYNSKFIHSWVGRPPIEYVNAGPHQKKKLALNLAVNLGHNTSLLVHAAAVSHFLATCQLIQQN